MNLKNMKILIKYENDILYVDIPFSRLTVWEYLTLENLFDSDSNHTSDLLESLTFDDNVEYSEYLIKDLDHERIYYNLKCYDYNKNCPVRPDLEKIKEVIKKYCLQYNIDIQIE